MLDEEGNKRELPNRLLPDPRAWSMRQSQQTLPQIEPAESNTSAGEPPVKKRYIFVDYLIIINFRNYKKIFLENLDMSLAVATFARCHIMARSSKTPKRGTTTSEVKDTRRLNGASTKCSV